ncbi:MAG: hypothetical protein AAGA15_17305 [Pseudomonadota bacterium]
MKTHLLALSIGVVALILAAGPSVSQTANCAARETVIERLASRYGESRQSVGMAANQTLMEVYANAGTGSWSLLVTLPNGNTCLVASGNSYEAMAEVSPSAMGEAL